MKLRFFEITGELHLREDITLVMRNMDAIGSLYFNFSD
jgi:hypothetical protein